MRLRHSHVPPTPRSSPATDASSLAGATRAPPWTRSRRRGRAPRAAQHVPAHDPQHQAAHRARRETRRRGGTRTHTRRRVSMMDGLRAVAKEDGGLAGLYRGIEPAVIGTVTSRTVYSYVYASACASATARMKTKAYAKKLQRRRGPRRALESLAIASVAGSINVVRRSRSGRCACACGRARERGEGKVSSPSERAGPGGKKSATTTRRTTVFFADASRVFEKSRPASSGGSVSSRASGSARGGGMDERGPPVRKVRKKTFLETTGAVWEENGLAGFGAA